MVQCKKCKQFLSLNKDETVKCTGGCEGVFHKKCVTNPKNFSTCTECTKAGSNPKHGSPGTTDPKVKITLNPNESGEKILAEVNKKLAVLYTMEERLTELTKSVTFCSEQYQQMLEFKDEAEKKFKIMEQKNIYLQKCNKALEERVLELESKEKEKSLEILGLEMKENENIKNTVQELATKLDLDPEEIEDAQRVGQEKPEADKPKIVLVTLKSKNARNKWLLAKKGQRITNNKVYGNGSDKNIYINEDIPKYKKQLLWMVRNKLKPMGFQFIWIQNSNILAKKNNEEKKNL
ncbi:hypothetical protein NE865_08254 [Phthorimaea operculella]|nr:hypothetical protein NE865_08254 [Phthorimaea operculella]